MYSLKSFLPSPTFFRCSLWQHFTSNYLLLQQITLYAPNCNLKQQTYIISQFLQVQILDLPLQGSVLAYILAWRIPRTERPGRLQCIGLQCQTQLKLHSMQAHRIYRQSSIKVRSGTETSLLPWGRNHIRFTHKAVNRPQALASQ